MRAAARSSQAFSSSVKRRGCARLSWARPQRRVADGEDDAHLGAEARRRAVLLEARRALGAPAGRVVEVGDAAPAARDVGELEVVGDQELVVPVRLALVGGQLADEPGADAQRRLGIGRRHEAAVGRDDAVDARGRLLEQLLRGQALARRAARSRRASSRRRGGSRAWRDDDPRAPSRVRASSSRMIPSRLWSPVFGGSTAARRRGEHRAMLTTASTPPSPRRSPAPSCCPATRAGTRPARRSTCCSTSSPAAVAFPADARDVAAPSRYARARRPARRAAGDRPTTRGRSATWRTRCCSTSAACRRSASIPARSACASAPGVKWDRVAPRLSAHGLAGLHGSSPDVGIAGYSLGGGMGWLARKHGLQTNAVTALELVTADGELDPRRRRARRPTCSGRCAAAAATSAS